MKKTGDIYLRSEYAKSEGTTRDTNQTHTEARAADLLTGSADFGHYQRY